MTSKWFGRLALLGVVLTLGVVVLGAYVRLSAAGLGCPDWPVCYGHLAWPTAEEHIAKANEAFPHRPVEVEKAWKEQVHRFFAASLGMIVFALALAANWRPVSRRGMVFGAALAALLGIFAYVGKMIALAAVLSLVAVLLPLYAATFWKGEWRARFTAGLLSLIIFQAMLGKWTVTLLVKPIIVTGHLFGGLATLVLMWLLWLRHRGALKLNNDDRHQGLRRFALAAIAVLLLQIFLGGWTSTNYAALACPDFPTCQTQWLPEMDFGEAFVLWRGLGIDYEGGVLDNAARVAIHFSHRIGAILVLLVVGSLVLSLRRRTKDAAHPDDAKLRMLGAVVGVLLIGQVLLGIATVKLALPLGLAVAHNGGAALLLASLVTLGYALWPRKETA
ncbi:MAG TPA: COX15/CtaA family protein [Gammaproteobacteria bacterium]|nr:COX15/CtaA family protein [Gammaproteobacteria bacterium]